MKLFSNFFKGNKLNANEVAICTDSTNDKYKMLDTYLNEINDDLTSKITYSKTEHAVGVWVDGKTLYSKTYTGTKTGGTDVKIALSDLNYDTLFFDVAHSFLKSSSGNIYPLPFGYTNSTLYTVLQIENNQLQIHSTTGAYTNGTYSVTILYTKK